MFVIIVIMAVVGSLYAVGQAGEAISNLRDPHQYEWWRDDK